MKKGEPERMYSGLFQSAERLAAPPDLWSRIEAQADLRAGARVPPFKQRPWLRMAASVTLAVGLVGLGFSLRHAPERAAVASAADIEAVAESGEQTDLVDPELLGWHADLGEVDEEADEAGEVL